MRILSAARRTSRPRQRKKNRQVFAVLLAAGEQVEADVSLVGGVFASLETTHG